MKALVLAAIAALSLGVGSAYAQMSAPAPVTQWDGVAVHNYRGK